MIPLPTAERFSATVDLPSPQFALGAVAESFLTHWRLGRSIHSRRCSGFRRVQKWVSESNFWLELSPTPISKMID